jgi:hypothetical protein
MKHSVRALELALAGWVAAACAPALAQGESPKPDAHLSKKFAIEVRSAPVASVAGQLSRALNVPLTADPAVADQRVDAKAAETTLSEFMRVSGHLLGGAWTASGEGESRTYTLTPDGPLGSAAARWNADRRTQFVRRLRQIAASMNRQLPEKYAASLRRRLSDQHPELPEKAIAEVTVEYLRQTLLLGPLTNTTQAQLARTRFVSIPIGSLAVPQQNLVLRFASAAFAGNRGFPADESAMTPESFQTALIVLSQPQARLEFRMVFGDGWSDLILFVRAGIPDHWATATLSGLVASLPDAEALQPHAEQPAQGADLTRRIQAPLSLAGLNGDQAITALAQAAGIKVMADSFARPAVFQPPLPLESLSGLTVREALDTIAESYGLYWWKQDGWFLFRHRLWPEEQRVTVPDSVLRQLGASAQRTGGLDPDSMAALISMDDEHLLTLNLIGQARGRTDAPLRALDLSEIDLIQQGFDFYRSLAPGQQGVAEADGLSLSDLSPVQRADFAALAYDHGYFLDPAELDSMYFRLSQTFPSSGASLGGGLVDGMIVVKLGLGNNLSRAATLSLRLPTPPSAPTSADRPPATSGDTSPGPASSPGGPPR